MTKIYKIEPDEVIVNDRQRRKEIKPEKFNKMKKSFKKFGQLTPGLCRLDEDGSPVLIFGETRLKLCQALELPFSYRLSDEGLSPVDEFEIELDENVCREDLFWSDEVDATLELHKRRQEEKGVARPGIRGGHGVKDTADELEVSVGKVQQDLEIAMWARAHPEVADAPTKTVAKNLIERFKKEVEREEALTYAIESIEKTKAELNSEIQEHAESGEVEETTDLEDKLLFYDSKCLLGTFEELLPTLQPESYDVTFFDPPWGVQLVEVTKQTGAKKQFDDGVVQKDLLLSRLQQLWQVMKPDSHLYLFFPIVDHGFVYDCLDEVGFKTNRMPIFWKKKGAHTTRNPKIWPGRCYEAIAFARKGSKDLVVQGGPDIIETAVPTAAIKQQHPSAKHPQIYFELLLRSCEPGDKVLDPMAGSGMLAVAAEALRAIRGLDWLQIEKDPDFRLLQIENLLKGFSAIIAGSGGSNAPSTLPTSQLEASGKIPDREVALPDLPEDFRELEPGSDEWKRFWKANLEQQEEMLAWKEKGK